MKLTKRKITRSLIGLLLAVWCVTAFALWQNNAPAAESIEIEEIKRSEAIDSTNTTEETAKVKEVLKVEQKHSPQKPKRNKNYDLSFRNSVVGYGQTLLGTPYVYAGCSTKGFDCSGFVYFVFKHFKVDVPRSSKLYADFGKEVNISLVQIGDVLVFKSPSSDAIGHVGIVTKANGMQTEFIHSSSGKSMGVIISSLEQVGYKNRYIKAVDVLGDR
jgi:cell wall-associated NlpC family hydrolase